MIIRIVGWMVGLGELLLAINLVTLFVAAFVKRFRRTAGGLLMGGVGIIPVAFFSLLFGREWLDLLELLFQVAIVLGGWQIAMRLVARN